MLLDDLDDEVIDRLTCVAGADSGSPLAVLQIRHLGGAFRRRSASHGVSGHLDEPYLLFALGVPAVPELATAIAATFDRLDLGMVGHTNGRTVPNFLGAEGDVERAWRPATRERLARIKAAVDPHHTIRSNRPVNGRGHRWPARWTGPRRPGRPGRRSPGSVPGLLCRRREGRL